MFQFQFYFVLRDISILEIICDVLVVSVLGVHWKNWCWSWNSSTLATSWEELPHWKRPWCWEGLGAWGEGGDRGWDGWMASLTRWAWVWVDSRSWWWTGRPGMLRFMGSQRVRHDWATELTDWLSGIKLIARTQQHPSLTPNQNFSQRTSWRDCRSSEQLRGVLLQFNW